MPEQNGSHFADDIFKCIFLSENLYSFMPISLKFVPDNRMDNKAASAQVMAWR